MAADRGRDASIEVVTSDGRRQAVLGGRWVLANVADRAAELGEQLRLLAADTNLGWNCAAVDTFDSAGAMLLWQAWGNRLPAGLEMGPDHRRIFDRLATAAAREPVPEPGRSLLDPLVNVGDIGIGFSYQLADFVALIGQFGNDLWHVVRHPSSFPGLELSANLYKSGVRALPVTALVGFLIGIVLSYLSSLQLRQLGADVFIVDLLGMGVIRELGPVLVAVLVAGRSGSAMTAQLGVMRVTEEIDALATMGVPKGLRLIFPKVAALSLAMPLLVLWASTIALIGGMVAAQVELDISYGFFIDELAKSVPVANLGIAMAKGVVFGMFVALVACHFGLRVQPNTESLSANTTASVVTSITVVILLDAVFAILTRDIGLP